VGRRPPQASRCLRGTRRTQRARAPASCPLLEEQIAPGAQEQVFATRTPSVQLASPLAPSATKLVSNRQAAHAVAAACEKVPAAHALQALAPAGSARAAGGSRLERKSAWSGAPLRRQSH